MDKFKKFLLISLLSAQIIILSACGISSRAFVIPSDKYPEAFEAAKNAGVKRGYTPVYEDKERGVIKLEQKIGKDEYRITVQFSKDGSVQVVGGHSADIINPFIGGDVKFIEKEILKVTQGK